LPAIKDILYRNLKPKVPTIIAGKKFKHNEYINLLRQQTSITAGGKRW